MKIKSLLTIYFRINSCKKIFFQKKKKLAKKNIEKLAKNKQNENKWFDQNVPNNKDHLCAT